MSATQDRQPIALKCPQCGANLPYTREEYAVCQYCGTSLIFHHQVRPSGESEEQIAGEFA